MKRLRDLQSHGRSLWYSDVEEAILDALKHQPWFREHVKAYIRGYQFRRLLRPYLWKRERSPNLETVGQLAEPGEYARIFISLVVHRKTKTRPRMYRVATKEPAGASPIARPIVEALQIPLRYDSIHYEDVCLN